MLKQFLEAGKIVGTHGIKGELRVDPWCDSPAFLAQFKTLYFNEGADKIKVSSRPHKNIVLMKLKGVETIEQAELLRGKVIYINRKDVKLPKGKNFVQDLMGCKVVDIDNDTEYGTVVDVFKTGANDVYSVKSSEDKTYLIPAIDSVVIEKNVEKGVILIRPMKGLFDDED
jgi:16S rRNA processing protein RimM